MEQKKFLEVAEWCKDQLEVQDGEECAYILIATDSEHVVGYMHGKGSVLVNALKDVICENKVLRALIQASLLFSGAVRDTEE